MGRDQIGRAKKKGQRAVLPDRPKGQLHPIYNSIATLDHAETARLLAIDPDCVHVERTKHGATPLMWAASMGGLDALKLLLEAERVQVNQTADGRRGYTALMFACEAGHHKAVALLCQLGEPLEIELGYALANGRTAHDVATHAGHYLCAKAIDADLKRRRDEAAAPVRARWRRGKSGSAASPPSASARPGRRRA